MKPHIIWRNVGGHNLAVGMGSDSDLRDLFKPHLSPALPHFTHSLHVYAGETIMPPQVLASGPKPCGGNYLIHLLM